MTSACEHLIIPLWFYELWPLLLWRFSHMEKDSNTESYFVKKISVNKTYKTTYGLVVLFSCNDISDSFSCGFKNALIKVCICRGWSKCALLISPGLSRHALCICPDWSRNSSYIHPGWPRHVFCMCPNWSRHAGLFNTSMQVLPRDSNSKQGIPYCA